MCPAIQTGNSSVPLVAPLGYFSRGDVTLAGGKGANLGELTQAGFNVPPGFVISTAAYDLLIENNHVQESIQDGLALIRSDEPAAIKQASQTIFAALMNCPTPLAVTSEVLEAYRRLGSVAVAVRSSATAEDLRGAAFAGQQETFLNVLGEDPLMHAVHACWASLWSERAIAYRIRQNIDQHALKIAVVVQQMVLADAAGVMFTANPVSGTREEIVIDANPGLGEAVVSGLVTPDHFIVNKRSGRIKEQKLGRREVIIRAKAGGGTEQTFPDQEGINKPSLSSQALHKLSQLGVAIERHYAAPQDIEWAWIKDGKPSGELLVLQTRPITALPEPLKINAATRRIIPILAEMWPSRPYPLDVTTFTGSLEKAIGNLLVMMIGRSAPNPDKIFVEEDGVAVRFVLPEVQPSPGMIIAPWLALWHTRRYHPSDWEFDPAIAELIEHAGELDRRELHHVSWHGILDTLQEALTLVVSAMQLRGRYFPKSLLGLGGLWLLLALTGQKDRLGVLLSGIETKTTETNRALERLAAQIHNHPDLEELFAHCEVSELTAALQGSEAGQKFLQDFSAFLAKYGHRETALTISQAAWKDQPEAVLGILKVLAVSPLKEADSYHAWVKARDQILAGSILGKWPLRDIFLKALANGRSLFKIREDTHFYATLAQPLARGAALELGRRLYQADALDASEDVFHLRLEELESLADSWPLSDQARLHIRTLVGRRKAKRAALANQPIIDPRLLEIQPRDLEDENVILNGSPGSPGIASGPARIVRDSLEFTKLQAGDVLVAPVTNPAWTPLFQRAAAVVVDTGSSASHAAIVAREYGIPAVMGTVIGTQRLSDGQWVQVDGSRGLVFKAEEFNEYSRK